MRSYVLDTLFNLYERKVPGKVLLVCTNYVMTYGVSFFFLVKLALNCMENLKNLRESLWI